MLDLDEGKNLLRIRKEALDDELVSQASTFYQISSEYTAAASRRDYLHQAYKVAQAEADLLFRKEAASSTDKWTETRIASEAASCELVLGAREEYLQACKAADEWGALRDAFHQRSFMLRDLVQLYIAGYYTKEAVTAPADVAAPAARKAMTAARRPLPQR